MMGPAMQRLLAFRASRGRGGAGPRRPPMPQAVGRFTSGLPNMTAGGGSPMQPMAGMGRAGAPGIFGGARPLPGGPTGGFTGGLTGGLDIERAAPVNPMVERMGQPNRQPRQMMRSFGGGFGL